ncbi:MFS transporter [Kitasatospora mediocidica]|uniref:MFS transporter n=1 Tax=Kitasatospora mediocidica TaxID=58352 RepID=UPI00068CA866|nr:MFS transporter [Kitasatospora mediocidica]
MTLRNDVRVLRVRPFRLFWTGQMISSFGDGMVGIVTTFALLNQGSGVGGLGVVLGTGMLFRVLASLLGGVTADRVSRRAQMAAADSVRCAVQLCLAAVAASGHATPLALSIGGALYGTAAGFYTPASAGLIPALVKDRSLFQSAAALQSLTRSSCMIVGPAVAGLLLAKAGAGLVYGIDAATFAVNATMLMRIPATQARGQRGRTFGTDLVQGWREVTQRRWLSLNLVAHAAWNLGMAAFFVLGPVLAKQHLGGSAAWGVVAAGMSAGSLSAGVVALRWRPKRPLVVGNLALTLGVLPLLALRLGLAAPLVAVAAAASNGGVVMLNALWTATLQRTIPGHVLSRISSYDTLLSLTTMPLGYALVGPAEQAAGQGGVLLIGVALVSLPSALVCLLPTVRGMRADPVQDDGAQGSPSPVPAPTAS